MEMAEPEFEPKKLMILHSVLPLIKNTALNVGQFYGKLFSSKLMYDT